MSYSRRIRVGGVSFIKNWRKREQAGMSTIANNLPLQRAIRRIAKNQINNRQESKSFDGAISAKQIDYSGDIYSLLTDDTGAVTISQGTTENQYIGGKITPSHITMRLKFHLADNDNMLRVIIFQSKGLYAPSTMADVLQSVGNIRAPMSALDEDFNDRFKVLADRWIQIDSYHPDRIMKITIPMKKIRPVHFSDSAGTAESGGIYMGIVSDSAADPDPTAYGYWRVYFKDA